MRHARWIRCRASLIHVEIELCIRQLWLQIILINLFVLVTGMIISIVGMALFCVGAIPAAVIVGLASAHLVYQLYEVYLYRGGEEIPLKPAAET